MFQKERDRMIWTDLDLAIGCVVAYFIGMIIGFLLWI